MMDFSGGAGLASANDLIPNGQVAWAIMQVRGLKGSASGGQYLDCELTIDDGQPYGRKKLWDMIGDPNHAGNSEAYRQMGLLAITRILEAGRGAGPNNPAGYQIAQYKDLGGLRVAIKIGIEKGKDGHADKNRVAEYLTPNPASQSGHKGFLRLQAGQHAPEGAAKPAASASGFGAAAQAQPAAQGGFGTNPATHQPAAAGFGGASASGFPQPQPQGDAQPAASQPSAGFAPTTTAPAQSPSDPTATPGWLAQAGGQAA